MELQRRLADIKKKVMKKISEAALAHDAAVISNYSAMANCIEEDERVLAGLEERIDTYEKNISDPSLSPLARLLEESRSAVASPKGKGREMGKDARMSFIEAGKSRGYTLSRIGSTIYHTATKKKIVIAFSNEHKPDRWFLGVKDDKYAAVVLLCQTGTRGILECVLPHEFLKEFWTSLSRSGDQVKFNVSRIGADYYLLVPGHPEESINRFRSAYGPLKD